MLCGGSLSLCPDFPHPLPEGFPLFPRHTELRSASKNQVRRVYPWNFHFRGFKTGPEGVKVCFSRAKTFNTNVTVVWGAIARDYRFSQLTCNEYYFYYWNKASYTGFKLVKWMLWVCIMHTHMMPVMWCWSVLHDIPTYSYWYCSLQVYSLFEAQKIFCASVWTDTCTLQHACMYGLKSMKIIVLLTMYTFIHLITIFDWFCALRDIPRIQLLHHSWHCRSMSTMRLVSVNTFN